MKIDIHTHINSTDQEELKNFVGFCEKCETVACICSAGPRCDHEYPDNSETLKAAKQYPGILIPFAFVNLWDQIDAGIIDEFAEQGFKGLKCITPYYPYDHDLYMPVYERAEKLKLPILFHTGAFRPNKHDVIYRRPSLNNMHPLTLDRIARSFPELKIVMAHLRTTFFRKEAAELVKLHPNLYADLAGSGSWMAIQPAELASLLGSCVAEVDPGFSGFKKLLLGSDAYVTAPQIITDAQKYYEMLLKRIGVPQDISAGIMGKTSGAWFK
ncbi:MAG: amidohydrolase family protein [Victivallaceae bacterium]